MVQIHPSPVEVNLGLEGRPSGKVAATYERQIFHGDSPRQIWALRAIFASRSRHLYEWASWTKTEKKREISFNHWW